MIFKVDTNDANNIWMDHGMYGSVVHIVCGGCS